MAPLLLQWREGIDELSWQMGQKYLTLVYQIDGHCPCSVDSACAWRPSPSLLTIASVGGCEIGSHRWRSSTQGARPRPALLTAQVRLRERPSQRAPWPYRAQEAPSA